MTRRTLAVAGLALIAVVATTARPWGAEQRRPVTGPRDREPPREAGASSIAGRVVDAATNAPIPRAQVQALGDDGIVDAITDEQGRYALAGLSAGDWRITVSKPGYFTREVGQRSPFESPPPVKVGARDRLAADVALSRGGVIAGRVFDDTGEPLAGLRVRVCRARMFEGYRRLETVGAADFTDDTGAYRIYSLPPGDYFVGASLRVAPVDSVVETTYAPTYFPGTGDLAGAQRIRLGLGSEASAVFPLLPVRQVRVSGSVTTAAGVPANAFLTLISEKSELGVPLGAGGVTREDGTFTLPDVVPGRYTLTALLRGNGPSEHGAVAVTVGGEDVSGLTIVTGKPATMRGRVVADAGASRALPSGLRVAALAARAGAALLASAPGPAFELDELVEPFHLQVDGLGDGWAVKSIVVNGVDATDRTVTLSTGQQAEARIVATDRVTVLTGTVSASGTATKADVVVFVEDAAKWSYPSRYVRVAQADERGRFRIAGLPPGERYRVVATDFLEDGEEHDPEFLERMREVAVALQLEEAEARVMDLVLRER